RPTGARASCTGLATGLAATRSTRTGTTARLAGRPRAARLVAVRVETTRVGVVGREHRCVARMAIGLGAALGLSLAATTGCATALEAAAARTSRTAAARTPAGTRPPGLVAVRLLGAAAVGVAVAARAGLHAVGHVPGAERGGVAFRQGAGALVLALLERALRLLGRRLAADRQATVALRAAAATATILADVVETTQFATFVGRRDMTADIGRAMAAARQVDRRLGRLALADYRLQGQRGRRTVLQPEILAQLLDALAGQLLRLPAQQLARQGDLAVADAL